MKRHYPAIRGIAMFLVILHHSIVLGTSIPSEWGYQVVQGLNESVLTVLSLFGWVAVPVFLFISGSFYAYAARGEPRQISYKIVQASMLGIIWPYTIWSLLYYLVEWVGTGKTYSIGQTIKNLLVGYPFHFVPLILFFILVSPILIKLSHHVRWLPLLALIALYQLFLIIALDGQQYNIDIPNWTNRFVIPVLARTMADWGIYFPLGLYLTLYVNQTTALLNRLKWYFLGLGLLFFGLTASHALGLVYFPASRHLFPLMLAFVVPVMQREWIPFRKFFETIGKHAYALYLTHLVFIYSFLLTARVTFPWILDQPNIIHLALLLLGLFVPLAMIKWVSRSKLSRLSPYLFG